MTKHEVADALRRAASIVSIAVSHLNTEHRVCRSCGHKTPHDRDESQVARHLVGTAEKLANQADRLTDAARDAAGEDAHDHEDHRRD